MLICDTPLFLACSQKLKDNKEREELNNALEIAKKALEDKGLRFSENRTAILTAFRWADTPQGDDYWHTWYVKIERR